MKNKNFFRALAGLIACSAAAITAYAQETGMIGSILSPFGRIESVYAKFGPFIDTLIYLIIFLGLAQVTLGKKFEYKKGGRAITVGVGLVLAIGLSLFGQKAGFNIASFGPMAAIILLALMGYAFYNGITSLEIEGVDKLTVAAAAYLLFYFGIQATVPNVIAFINSKVPVVGGLLALVALGFTVYIIYSIVMFAGRFFKGGASSATDSSGRLIAGLTPHERKAAETPERSDELEDEIDLILSRIHTARNHLQKLKEAIAKIPAVAKRWADSLAGKPIGDEAKAFAKQLADAIEKEVMEPYKNAREDLMDAVTQARKVMHTSKFSAEVKKRVEKIRHEIEASHDHLNSQVKEKRIDSCVEALNAFANGRGKRTPDKISEFILSHAKNGIEYIDTIMGHLAAIWKEAKDLSEAIKHPSTKKGSRGIAVLK